MEAKTAPKPPSSFAKATALECLGSSDVSHGMAHVPAGLLDKQMKQRSHEKPRIPQIRQFFSNSEVTSSFEWHVQLYFLPHSFPRRTKLTRNVFDQGMIPPVGWMNTCIIVSYPVVSILLGITRIQMDVRE